MMKLTELPPRGQGKPEDMKDINSYRSPGIAVWKYSMK